MGHLQNIDGFPGIMCGVAEILEVQIDLAELQVGQADQGVELESVFSQAGDQLLAEFAGGFPVLAVDGRLEGSVQGFDAEDVFLVEHHMSM